MEGITRFGTDAASSERCIGTKGVFGIEEVGNAAGRVGKRATQMGMAANDVGIPRLVPNLAEEMSQP